MYTSRIYYRMFRSPASYSTGYWLVYYCPNQLLHCTVRLTNESPLLPHVHISYYLGLQYWLLAWVILCTAAHSALHYNYFIVQFAHESPSLPHVQVSFYLLMDIGFCNSLFSSPLQLCTILYTTINYNVHFIRPSHLQYPAFRSPDTYFTGYWIVYRSTLQLYIIMYRSLRTRGACSITHSGVLLLNVLAIYLWTAPYFIHTL